MPSDKALTKTEKKWLTTGVVAQLAQIEAELGGRSQLVQLLALAPLTADLRYILGMLGDPRMEKKALAEICAAGNILPGELLKQLQSAALLRGRVIAAQEISRGTQAVVQDVMRRAAPYEDACHACLGVGKVTAEPTQQIPNPSPQPCQTCNGTGRLVYRPELDRQRVALDLAQLVPKGGAGGVNILQQFGNAGGGPSGAGGGQSPLEKLALLTDKLLYGSGAPIEDLPVDGEVVPDATEGGSDVPPAE